MPSLMMTVISVALIAFVLVAGVSYINPSAQSRVEVAKVLDAQYAAYMSGVASYKIENSGVAPESLDDVSGYVTQGAKSGFGNKVEAFTWSMDRNAAGAAVLCVTYRADGRTDYGVLQGIERLAMDAARQRPGKVSLGNDCTGPAIQIPTSAIAAHINGHKSDYSVRIEVN